MIAKERLKYLKRMNERVFILIDDKSISAKLNSLCNQVGYVDDKEHFVLFDPDDRIISITNEDLFETKEDVEEYLKYGKITKIEELVMADWGDIKNATYALCGSFWSTTLFYTLNIKDSYIFINMTDYSFSSGLGTTCLFKKEFNRENYNEARDLFVKWFMGEEE